MDSTMTVKDYQEWVELILEAKRLGLSLEEIQMFLQEQSSTISSIV
ncbi:DNA-binding anti-repressor SinI [Bacillus sp. HMF5848]|nr:anti-repressor SinI family protein [Bacillus sp. HMF5848]RSK29271.1 DNA-binding anti-repressor SinI [Bacillus sp. HMF5848]